MTSLTSLELNHTDVGDKVCQSLTALPELENINLDETSITDQGVRVLIAGSPHLTKLSLRNCKLSIEALSTCKSWPAHLKELWVTGTKLTGEDVLNLLKTRSTLDAVYFDLKECEPETAKQIENIRTTRLHRSLYGQ